MLHFALAIKLDAALVCIEQGDPFPVLAKWPLEAEDRDEDGRAKEEVFSFLGKSDGKYVVFVEKGDETEVTPEDAIALVVNSLRYYAEEKIFQIEQLAEEIRQKSYEDGKEMTLLQAYAVALQHIRESRAESVLDTLADKLGGIKMNIGALDLDKIQRPHRGQPGSGKETLN